MAFLGICICATGITSREEKTIQQITNELGIKYLTNLTKSVTHLIVKKVGSEKHALAQKQNIFCVEMKWLLDCKAGMNRMNEESYQVLPFTGLNISVSQLEPDERHRITRLVEANGGKFGRNIEKDVTTHLICLRPEGDKYNAAKSWKNVKIINVQWIDDCVRKLVWIDEKEYPVFPSTTSISSTQTTIPASIPDKPSSRMLPIMKRAVSKIRRNMRELTQIDNDISLPQESEIKTETRDFMAKELSQLNDLIPSGSLSQLEQRLRPHVASNSLRNEVIFVSGFDDQTTVKIVKLIIFGSGFRSAILSERITKCLLGPSVSDRLLHAVVTHPLSPEALTLAWLMETVIPTWKTLLSPCQDAPSASIPLPTLSSTLGSGSTESEEIQLRENLRNSGHWSSTLPPRSKDEQNHQISNEPTSPISRNDSLHHVSPVVLHSVFESTPTLKMGAGNLPDKEDFDDEYEVHDDSEEDHEEEHSDWEEQPLEFSSKKRTRWEGGRRRKKQLPSQNQTQEGSYTPQLSSAIGTLKNSSPSAGVMAFATPRSHGRPRRGVGHSPGGGSGVVESQMVVYEADTQPPFESSWLS